MDVDDKDKIWWLASYPKSGSTWVRLLLSAYHRNGVVDPNGISNSTGDLQQYFLQRVSPRPVEQLSELEVVVVRQAALLHQMLVYNFRPFVVKTHNLRGEVGGMALFPEGVTSGGIYLVRDPRDVALSYARHYNCTVDQAIKSMADPKMVISKCGDDPFIHYLHTWSNHVGTWANSPFPVFVCRYEDLQLKPVKILTRILEHMGLEVDEDRAKRAVEACAFDKMRAVEDEKGFSEKPEKMGAKFFHSGRSTWREALTKEQAQRIVDDHGKVMEQLKYDTAALQNIA